MIGVPMTFEIVDSDELDYEAFSFLQREAYADLLEKMKVSNVYMTPDFYRWKFHPPAGKAKISQVREGKRLLSAIAMIPVEVCLGKNRLIGWQYCDGATLPESRRKGHYEKCMHTLVGTLKPDEVFFGYPNPASIRRIVDLGCKDKGVIPTWIKPMFLPRSRRSPSVTRIKEFGKDQNDLADRLVEKDRAMLSRSRKYLNWRYTRHPVHDYTSFIYRDEGELEGFTVVRTANARGHKMVLVMELWGIEPRVSKELIRNISVWSSRQGIRWLVMQDNGLPFIRGLTMGFILAPACILPKKQGLVVLGNDKKLPGKVINSDWHMQFGDWDGF